jgi:hypothetical protein
MATAWTNPSLIVQYSEIGAENIHARWDDSLSFSQIKSSNGQTVGTLEPLYNIARSPKPNVSNKTYYVRCTGYNFQNLPESISGIELKLTTRRAGRITDDTIQLCLEGATIGENQANLEINPIKVYGGQNSLWGLSSISLDTIKNLSFGVILRFKSHPSWPHRDPADLDSVELRIH